MGWADSATGGGYGGGSSRGGGSSSSGGGGYSSGFGSQVDTGGTRGGGGGGGTNFGNEVATEGSGSGYGAGHNSTGGGDGGVPTSRAQQATQTRAQARRAGIYGEIDTPGVMGSVTDGAIASFDDEATLDRTAVKSSLEAANYEGMVHDDADTGILGTASTVAASLFGGPAAGLVAKAGLDAFEAKRASDTLAATNDLMGFDQENAFDDGYGRALGQQATRSVAGNLGGRLGGTLLGSLTGSPIAAVTGGLIGSNLAKSAVSTPGSSAPSTGPDGTPGSVTGGGAGAPSGATMMASSGSSMNPQAGQSASQQSPADYGPVDFDGYASYAIDFFS